MTNPLAVHVTKRLLKEVLLTLILFNVFNIAFSTTLQFVYGSPDQQDYALSIILSIFSIIVTLGMAAALLAA